MFLKGLLVKLKNKSMQGTWGKSHFKTRMPFYFSRFFCNFHMCLGNFKMPFLLLCYISFLFTETSCPSSAPRTASETTSEPPRTHTKEQMHVFWSFSFVIFEFFNVLAKKEQIATTRLLDRVVKFFGQGTGSDLKIEQSSTLGYPSGPGKVKGGSDLVLSRSWSAC